MKKIKMIFNKTYIIILLFVFLFSVVFLNIISKKIMPVIIDYATMQTKKIGIEVLRNAGLKEVNENFKNKELFKTTVNNNNEIESIDFDTGLINESLLIIAKNVRKRLKEVELGKNLPSEMYDEFKNKKLKKGIIYKVPLGAASKNAFFSNFGPYIPVKVKYTGNVGLDVKTRVKNYGINSALIEVYVYVEVTQKTIIPFRSKDIKLTSEIPIVMKVVKGTVPNYYSNSNRSYSLPIN